MEIRRSSSSDDPQRSEPANACWLAQSGAPLTQTLQCPDSGATMIAPPSRIASPPSPIPAVAHAEHRARGVVGQTPWYVGARLLGRVRGVRHDVLSAPLPKASESESHRKRAR